MSLESSVILENRKAYTWQFTRCSALRGEIFQGRNHSLRFAERQKMPATVDNHDLSAWHNRLAIGGEQFRSIQKSTNPAQTS